MIPRVVVQPQAARDAEEIYAYLAQRDVAVARRFNEAVADTIIAIQQDPQIGMAWQATRPRLKELRWKRVPGFKKYLIFYRVEGDAIQIARLLHGARDIGSLLGD